MKRFVLICTGLAVGALIAVPALAQGKKAPLSPPADTSVTIDGNIAPGHLRFFHLNPWRWLRMTLQQQPAPTIRVEPLTVLPANQLLEDLLPHIGARPADRDSVDARLVRELMERKGRIIDSPQDAGGLPTAAHVERVNQIPENPNEDGDRDGYTDIEEWLHEMAAKVEGVQSRS